MLYLLEGNEFELKLDCRGRVNDLIANFSISKIIYNKLVIASKTNELIHTQWLRNVGKTFELIQFAKHRCYLVIHPDAYNLREKYHYDNIFTSNINILRGNSIKDIVIDEGISNLQELKDAGFNIITGYYTPKKENEKSFDETVIDNLKNELDLLTYKIQKSRENQDYGTYKNLILAYKEILNLYMNINKGK